MTACVCGHLTHFGECGEPITRTAPDGLIRGFCHCSIFELDDGTDGPSTAPGPHHASDPYKGKYGTNQRYPRGEAS